MDINKFYCPIHIPDVPSLSRPMIAIVKARNEEEAYQKIIDFVAQKINESEITLITPEAFLGESRNKEIEVDHNRT